eukprot:EG_transcript_19345
MSATPAAPVIICFGEALYDLLPSGAVLGGAPLNLAIHARQLGAESHVCSCVGADADGDLCHEVLQRYEVAVDLLQVDPAYRTGCVTVTITASGEPQYTIEDGVAWDHIKWTAELEAQAKRANCVCFGSLALRGPANREVLRRIWAASPGLKLFDINIRPPFIDWDCIEESLTHADALKANEDEWPELVTRYPSPSAAPAPPRPLDAELARIWAEGQGLRARFGLRWVVLTRGARGTALVTAEDIYVGQPVAKEEGGDVVGAGDSCTAALLMGLLTGRPPQQAVQHANRVGAYVASQVGATPLLPDALRNWEA